MSLKNLEKRKSENSLKENSQKSSCQKSTPSYKSRHPRKIRKITEEHEPFIFEQRAKGFSYRGLADALKEEYNVLVDHTSIFYYFRSHIEGYRAYLSDLKEVRLANAKARIFGLQQMAEKLSESIFNIIQTVPKKQWDAIHLAGLIREYRELLAQIQDEVGDKIHKVKAEGITGDLIFGDKVINAFADKAIKARIETTADPGNRVKAFRFSDSRNSLSGN